MNFQLGAKPFESSQKIVVILMYINTNYVYGNYLFIACFTCEDLFITAVAAIAAK